MLRAPSLPLALLVVLALAACSDRRPPIDINDGTVILENQTGRDWRNVMITVNDHFRGGAPLLRAGSRMNAPLSQFQTAYGQRFALDRQVVYKVEVTATDSSGEAVTLQWGESRRTR